MLLICTKGEYSVKNKSVIVEWIICYIIILLIPIITIFINYFCNVEVIKKETYKSNAMILNNLADNVDKILEEEVRFYEQLLSCHEYKLASY